MATTTVVMILIGLLLLVTCSNSTTTTNALAIIETVTPLRGQSALVLDELVHGSGPRLPTPLIHHRENVYVLATGTASGPGEVGGKEDQDGAQVDD